MTPTHYGIMINPIPTDDGKTTMYAELVPSSALVYWVGFNQFRNWHKYWPLATGRSWKEPHVRWWFEVMETDDPTKEWPDGAGSHWWMYDGGATTLRRALVKASNAVAEALEAKRTGKHD